MLLYKYKDLSLIDLYSIVQKSWIRISTDFLAFRGFSTKFRFKRKFGDISANFRDAYYPNPRELSTIFRCARNIAAKIWQKCARLENSQRELSFSSPSVFEESSNAMIEI